MKKALNQMTVRHLGYVDFLDLARDLARDLGCIGVEVRNDLGRPLFDGVAPAEAGDMARSRGLRLLGMSEVYAFNTWSDEIRGKVETIIAGAVAAVAAIVLSSKNLTAQAGMGVMYELDAIAMAVIGGISLQGGRGSILGTVLGALIFGVIISGFTFLKLDAYY
ncbi:ABC transporter permease subunit [Anianabacter salinae]